MTRLRSLLITCALSAFWSFPVSSAAIAADATSPIEPKSDQSVYSIETVVVTAEKRSQALIDIPASISVVTAQDIQDKHLIALSDISTRMPNVLMDSSSLYPAITIRGVTSVVSGGNPGFAPAAAVYVDDVYQGRDRATNIPLSGISQIEVLRGPQGTLYGKNTIAGAINITTQKPTDEFVAQGDAQYGNYNFNQFTAFVGGPVVDDKVLVSFSGIYRHRDGWILNTFDNSHLNFDNALGGRARVIYDATPNLTFDFSADYLHENDTETELTNANTEGAVLPFPPFDTVPLPIPGKRIEALNKPDFSSRDVHGLSGRFDYDFTAVRLTSITAWRGYNSRFGIDGDGTALNGQFETGQDNAHQISQELRLTSTEPGPFQWIAGGYFYQELHTNHLYAEFDDQMNLSYLFGFGALPPGYRDSSNDNSRISETSYAAFLSGTYDFTPDLTLAAGIRYTHETRNLALSQEPDLVGMPHSFIAALIADIPPLTERSTDSVPTYDASLTYKFTPDQVGYVKISRGYKAGGFNATLITLPFDPATDSLAFKPEFLNNYEIGFKSSWWDGRFTLNSSLFWDDYTNKQELSQNPNPPYTLTVKNAASATIYGAEFEAALQPVDGLMLTATLGLLNGKYTDFPDASGTLNFKGNRLPFAPRLDASLAAEYSHELSEWPGVFGFARFEATDVDNYFTEPGNNPAFEANAIWNLNGRLGIDADKWGVYLWGQNLANTFHLAQGTVLVLATTRAVNAPRMFGIEVSLKN